MSTKDPLVAQLAGMANIALGDDRVPDEQVVCEMVAQCAKLLRCSDEVVSAATKVVLAQRVVKMDTGFAVAELHKPWVSARRAEIEPFYWNRYKILLHEQGFAPGAVHGLNGATDGILDLLGNPAEHDTWKRRGLVVGDVQSGKTATYAALICKAADAGYRFIVLLTGTIENLRRQTQERLDAAFVGRDSSEYLKRNRKDIQVGVGKLDPQRNAVVFTSKSSDFRSATMESLGLSLDALKEPALVVVKKHTRILGNLRDWLCSYNAAAGAGLLDIPFLLIDDEADNASINTNDKGCDPTRVNAGIRELLKLFRRTTYVGFTATPFANIFVDPDGEHEMLADDLFPRDFIYTLDAPSNYFGPRRIFTEEDGSERYLRAIEDADAAIPAQHKSSLSVSHLPVSLGEALCAFLVSNAIRDLRGEGSTHRSMLVNVSQFTAVQDQVEMLIKTELERLQNDVRNFSGLAPESALRNSSLRRLHDVWAKEYADCEFAWEDVQGALRQAVGPIDSIAVNQRTGPRALDYKAHAETGLRVIAVGGNSLSRGLTLEGLCISYFRRSSRMYDTLMQMGRWFGYRPGYQDLCRIWLPQEATDWYGHISEATDELKDEFRRMHNQGLTPKDFGLAVRAHPDSLLVTARNKARADFARDQYLPVSDAETGAHVVVREVGVSGRLFESVELPLERRALESNYQRVEQFVQALRQPGVMVADYKGMPLWREVPAPLVARLLAAFQVPQSDLTFQPSALAELLQQSVQGPDPLARWDVLLAQGQSEPQELDQWTVKRAWRSVLLSASPASIHISGTKRRVGSRGIECAGLADEAIERAQALASAHWEATNDSLEPAERGSLNVADRFYRQVRTRPLLLIYMVEPRTKDAQVERRLAAVLARPLDDGQPLPLAAVGLSFPVLDSDRGYQQRFARYKINLVKLRELYGDPGDDEASVEELQ
ncbi:MAG: DEAD/DEAH box helicase family protein [Burkholderiales bacterium]|nr:DEAD/DEAH box helicase family protein [Burkholderiales bacterium]